MARGCRRVKPGPNTYLGYSVGCAGVWALLLLLGRRRLDAPAWSALKLSCAGWWSGWTSATIARAGYPPPRPLSPAGGRRLKRGSVVLVALGLASAIRLLFAGRLPHRGR